MKKVINLDVLNLESGCNQEIDQNKRYCIIECGSSFPILQKWIDQQRSTKKCAALALLLLGTLSSVCAKENEVISNSYFNGQTYYELRDKVIDSIDLDIDLTTIEIDGSISRFLSDGQNQGEIN